MAKAPVLNVDTCKACGNNKAIITGPNDIDIKNTTLVIRTLSGYCPKHTPEKLKAAVSEAAFAYIQIHALTHINGKFLGYRVRCESCPCHWVKIYHTLDGALLATKIDPYALRDPALVPSPPVWFKEALKREHERKLQQFKNLSEKLSTVTLSYLKSSKVA